MINVVVENQSSVVSEHEYLNLCWGLNYHSFYHIGRSPWNVIANVKPLAKGAKPPAGSWNIILMDNSTEAGALGYHEDEQGSNIPFADIFCKTAKEDGVTPSEVACHELDEALVDPYVFKPRTVTHGNKIYIVEVCDACQGFGFDVGAPEGRTTGVIVADFCYPSWFNLKGTPSPLAGSINLPESKMTFRNAVPKLFELAKEGYISYAPINKPEQWTQIFGQQRDKAPGYYLRDRHHDNLNEIWHPERHTYEFTKR